MNVWIIFLITLGCDCGHPLKIEKPASYWEAKYNFEPLPIGGQIVMTVASGITTDVLPEGYEEGVIRPLAHQAYCLLKLPSDSSWYHIAGNPLRMYTIEQDTGNLSIETIEKGEYVFVKAGDWKAAHVISKKGYNANVRSYSLVMAINVPGVIPSDVTIPTRAELVALYPLHADVIKALTPP